MNYITRTKEIVAEMDSAMTEEHRDEIMQQYGEDYLSMCRVAIDIFFDSAGSPDIFFGCLQAIFLYGYYVGSKSNDRV